ncbi:alpha-amylase [Anaerosacchariphilus sp. NSJ-68]|uniref:Alpha-amylase n=2 Tax=Lachnospiraceae TaxID=186803 RepID=A0A923L9Y3_9FIRM|nr:MULTISPECIES: alpha-amylase family glycosyl hydrolase [Lachnospiraceae]MBC5658516.1 alpha-amylase [Anaerosacchariphilus hominis]MBC5698275.1 alpha-amylase [Roseburia difficilis]
MGKWYDEAIFYHIYPLGLLGAPKTHTEEGVTHRLRELDGWVDHMKECGFTAVYIGPLFESTSHGYDTKDYKQIDSRLGDNEDFRHFVKLCHENGIRVVVDGVFNHTGREFFAFQDIQKNREQSPYRYWYQDVSFEGNTHYNDGFYYKAWHNCFELANLNLWDRGVKDYLLDVVRFWIDEFDIDGIRLDCADCLQFDFMKELRWVTGQKKEDFWLMGEVIHGDYARWVNDETLHSVTNYELWKGLYSGHNDHNYFEIAHTIRRQFDANGGIYRGCRLYTFVENHDVDRIVNKLNEKGFLQSVYTLLYTLPGIPSVYYGGEWGVEGRKEGACDDGLRPRLILEEQEAEPPVPELEGLIRKLGALRRQEPALTDGTYRELLLTNRQYAFGRILDGTAVVTAVNNDSSPAHFEIQCPVGASEAAEALTGEKAALRDGKIMWEMPAYGSAVFTVKQG